MRRSRLRPAPVGVFLGVVSLLLAGCGMLPGSTITLPADTCPVVQVPTAALAPSPTPTPTCDIDPSVTAKQVVLVQSSGSAATIRACQRDDDGTYTVAFGPYAGHVGENGVSADRTEGDKTTPAGVFPLLGGFGLHSNPGLRIGTWFVVDKNDVWVDDPDSPLYNTHQRLPARGRWLSAENLDNPDAYEYAQIIGFNEQRTPGLGSAIFLHVDTGEPTVGCVSLAKPSLLTILRWESAGAVIDIE
ncbi:MAG: hypothetical protein FWF28_08780 [Micrococcales bacterium]|nr:hypothetical protein [Micrococcales bacterium]